MLEEKINPLPIPIFALLLRLDYMKVQARYILILGKEAQIQKT